MIGCGKIVESSEKAARGPSFLCFSLSKRLKHAIVKCGTGAQENVQPVSIGLSKGGGMGGNMQPVASTGKHPTDAKHKKIYKYTNEKRGKVCNRF